MSEKIIGLWDGHDSSCCIVEGNKILFCNNEEKYNNLKLWSGFPKLTLNRIKSLYSQNNNSLNVSSVSYSTSDISKTIQRVNPKIKENYYYFRRRKKYLGFQDLRRKFKYSFTNLDFSNKTHFLNNHLIKKQVNKSNIKSKKYTCINHHLAHASSGQFTSNFNKSLIITYDGVGDGLCSSVYLFENDAFNKLFTIPAKHSIAIFYEQATNLVGFRELEDEGKLMGLSDYYIPFKDEKNPFLDFFYFDKLILKARFGPRKMYDLLKRVAFSNSREKFAYYVQRTTQYFIFNYIKKILTEYPYDNLILSGGLFSNIKITQLVKDKLNLKKLYVFPYMGDGGLSLGSALYTNFTEFGIKKYKNVKDEHFLNYLGDEIKFDDKLIKKEIKSNKNIGFEKLNKLDISNLGSDIISNKQILLYANGRTEIGPRALGNRSILCSPNDLELKNELNLMIKGRDWFMPFAPSILQSKAKDFFYNSKIPNYHMTCSYSVKKEKLSDTKSVVNVDDTARPQFVNSNISNYHDLLNKTYKKTNLPLVLNTSFNLHGLPIVNDFKSAMNVFLKTTAKHMILNDTYFYKKL